LNMSRSHAGVGGAMAVVVAIWMVALAERIGCTWQTIIMLEQGRYAPSLGLALKIAKRLTQQLKISLNCMIRRRRPVWRHPEDMSCLLVSTGL